MATMISRECAVVALRKPMETVTIAESAAGPAELDQQLQEMLRLFCGPLADEPELAQRPQGGTLNSLAASSPPTTMLEPRVLARELAQLQDHAKSSAGQFRTLLPAAADCLAQLQQRLPGDEVARHQRTLLAEAPAASTTSSVDDGFAASWTEFLGVLQTGFIDVYKKVMEGISDWFKSCTDVFSRLTDTIKSTSENKEISWDWDKFKGEIDYLKDTFFKNIEIDISPKSDGAALLKYWKDKLAPDSSVTLSADGKKIIITPDKIKDILNEISNSIKRPFVYMTIDSDVTSPTFGKPIETSGPSPAEVSVTTFQAWQAGFDSQKSAIQSLVTKQMDSYRQSVSTFDNLIQVFMGMISSMTRIGEGFTRI